jgi:hypothetical protein
MKNEGVSFPFLGATHADFCGLKTIENNGFRALSSSRHRDASPTTPFSPPFPRIGSDFFL